MLIVVRLTTVKEEIAPFLLNKAIVCVCMCVCVCVCACLGRGGGDACMYTHMWMMVHVYRYVDCYCDVSG